MTLRMTILPWLTATLLTATAKSSELTYNAALNKPAYQSSVFQGIHTANLANDGSRHTSAHTGTRCAVSNIDINPWWAVDLGRPITVYRVLFTNRGDGWAYRSNNFIVGLTNVSPEISTPTLWNYTLCGQYPGAVPAGATVSLDCQANLPQFRYVIVQFPITNHMNFCELEVMAPVPLRSTELTYNAALNKPAYQSSVYRDRTGSYPPNMANDGSRHTIYNTGTRCAHTNRDINPWWAVDLGGPTAVYRVHFTNRGDEHAYRSDNFIVGLTNVSPEISTPTLWNYTVCGQYSGAVPAGATVSLYCLRELLQFRYVIVQFPITDHMNFCELEVMAPVTDQVLREVALNKRSYQVSTYADEFGAHGASLANDGSRQTNQLVSANSCAQSNNAVNPWWAVDLENETLVVQVDLTNRGDCCGNRSNNFVVGLTNNHPVTHAPVLWNYTLCGQYPGVVPDGATVSVHCTNTYTRGLRFRFVIVQFPTINEPLNICEIEVFALDLSLTSQADDNRAYTFADVSRTTTTTATTATTTANEHKEAEPNPAIIALSLLAGVLIILAVILLIVLLKQRAHIKQLLEKDAREPADQQQYETITPPDRAINYEQLEMTH